MMNQEDDKYKVHSLVADHLTADQEVTGLNLVGPLWMKK